MKSGSRGRNPFGKHTSRWRSLVQPTREIKYGHYKCLLKSIGVQQPSMIYTHIWGKTTIFFQAVPASLAD
jgi:hypothetical protein